jgi:hypothetical protein
VTLAPVNRFVTRPVNFLSRHCPANSQSINAQRGLNGRRCTSARRYDLNNFEKVGRTLESGWELRA